MKRGERREGGTFGGVFLGEGEIEDGREGYAGCVVPWEEPRGEVVFRDMDKEPFLSVSISVS